MFSGESWVGWTVAMGARQISWNTHRCIKGNFEHKITYDILSFLTHRGRWEVVAITKVMTLVGGQTRSRTEVVLSRGLMDGPVEIWRRDWPAVKHHEKHPYGSMDSFWPMLPRPPLIRPLPRAATIRFALSSVSPNASSSLGHSLARPCFLRAPVFTVRQRGILNQLLYGSTFRANFWSEEFDRIALIQDYSQLDFTFIVNAAWYV